MLLTPIRRSIGNYALLSLLATLAFAVPLGVFHGWMTAMETFFGVGLTLSLVGVFAWYQTRGAKGSA